MEKNEFVNCVLTCAKDRELVKEFNRLSGRQLLKRSPLESAIDSACGYEPNKEYIKEFISFVYYFVWSTYK